MKTSLSLATLLLLIGSSCQQPSNNKNLTEVAVDNEIQKSSFVQQDSILAGSMFENQENSTSPTAKFSQHFFAFLEQNPSSINYEFPKLKEVGLHIASSSDGKIRIYSWDDNQGGSMRFFNNIFQVNNGSKQILKLVSTEEDRTYYPFYTNIEAVQLEGQVYYIAYARNIFSHKEVNYSAELYKIEGDQVTPAKLFKTKEGLDHILGETFNYEELGDSDQEFIQLDSANLTLSFPEVTEDGKFNKKRNSYQFNGKYFEKI